MGLDEYDPVTSREPFDPTMPLVGLYIIAASAVCTLAMAADLFNGFRLKKLWFPCKYFSLNATSLTYLAVAMKPAMDVDVEYVSTYTFRINRVDMLAKYSSLILMSVALANFMTSLGSMNNKNILQNVVALGILVITITGNVFIQLIKLKVLFPNRNVYMLYLGPVIIMLLPLATLVSLAIMAPTAKRILELKYQEEHKLALRDEEVLKRGVTFDTQRRYMMKYLVMAETSNPQFVMARSVICTTTAVICLLPAVSLILDIYNVLHASLKQRGYIYGGITIWVLFVQSIGVTVGIIAPLSRWFIAVSFKCSMIDCDTLRRGFNIEAYWIQTLVEWRDSSSPVQIRRNKGRKYLHDAKWFTLTLCIGVQIFIVLLTKFLLFLSTLLLSPVFLCIKKFLRLIGHDQDVDDDTAYENLSHYVCLLEGDAMLPKRVVKSIYHEADSMIKTGRKKQPQSLIGLLHKVVNFNGIGQFDSSRIPSLHDSQEPPNCWTLPIVTLTSIAIALPSISNRKRKRLLSCVGEGIFLTKIVEKTLLQHAELVNIRKAAGMCWVGVLVYMKWLNIDLKKTSLECRNSIFVLRELSDKAGKKVMDFKREVKDKVMENPLNWPENVLAANSMYRISRTILSSCDEETNNHTDEGLFDLLSIMIADILAACFTNVPHTITTMCHRNAIEKRERSVRKAFLLLGQTEQIVEFLRQLEWPLMDHDEAASIDKWRVLFQQDQDDPMASTSSDESMSIPSSGEDSSEEQHAAEVADC